MYYGTLLKELRIKNDLTQADIANILKISPKTYNHYEVMENIIPLKHLNTLCNYYNISIDYLFGFTKTKKYNFTNTNIDINIISERLKSYRKENKISQEDIAILLNTNRSVIANYERKRTLISTSCLYVLCDKYFISADYILGRIDKKITFKKKR